MTLPTVLMCSMWRNDVKRDIEHRAFRLLSKTDYYPELRFLWVVGDSQDDTAELLPILSTGHNVTVLDIGKTNIDGDDADSRLRRLSVTANHYLKYADGVDYILIHESDIVSPPNVVNRLVAHAESGRCPIAAWPTLEVSPGVRIFYDVFAYRKDGVRFTHTAPYHPSYRADRPFIVDSAGTVFMFHAEDAAECIMANRAILDLCWHLREMGRDIWVDPTLEVCQPPELWEYHRLDKGYA